jgi:hypothetical protein
MPSRLAMLGHSNIPITADTLNPGQFKVFGVAGRRYRIHARVITENYYRGIQSAPIEVTAGATLPPLRLMLDQQTVFEPETR